MFRVGRLLCDSAKQDFSVGRQVLRGVAIGGLAGGMIGLGIELSPENSWVKKTADGLLSRGQEYFHKPVKQDTVAKPGPEQEEWRVLKKRDEVIESIRTEPIPKNEPKEVVHGDSKEEEAVETHSIHAPEAHPSKGEEAPEVFVEQNVEDSFSEPAIEERTQESVEVTSESDTDTENANRETRDLVDEITSLKEEVALLTRRYESDMAQAAGAAQATLDTLDRLYGERQAAVSTARHGLLVNELLVEMVRDRSATSSGALRVAFQEALPDMVSDCFVATDASFFKVVLGKLLALLYCPTAGLPRSAYSFASPTCKRLMAIQSAKDAVQEGNFIVAVSALENLDSDTGNAWRNRTKVAMQLWQGAEAAVASMHEDLAKVL